MAEYINLHNWVFIKQVSCERISATLKEMRDEQKFMLRSKSYNQQTICGIVNPIIIRLNEGKHATIVADHDPKSEPNSPRNN